MKNAEKVIDYFSRYESDINGLYDFIRVHLELLLKWQKIGNLVGLSSELDIAEFLYLDSFIALRNIKNFLDRENINITDISDIGSGAGFPSIFWRYFLPDAIVVFYEAKRKKANFLREFIRMVGLKNYKVIEEMVQKGRLSSQLIISKAAININDLPRFGMSNLRHGGVLVSMLTDESKDIYLRSLSRVGKIGKSELIEYILPYSQKRRFIGIAIKK